MGNTLSPRFDFKADVIPSDELWWNMGIKEQVFTGHWMAPLRSTSVRPMMSNVSG